MHYIITDIHNDNRRFTELLQKINLTEKDHLYLLGDLFDRCEDHADLWVYTSRCWGWENNAR